MADESSDDERRSPGAGRQDPHVAIDLYELLQISPRASQDVIHAAYRALARSYHPDHNESPEAAARIRSLNAAYAVLSDPAQRARYDLEATRAHRRERMSRPTVGVGASAVQPALRLRTANGRVLNLRAVPQPIGPRNPRPILEGQVALGLLVLFVLAAIMVLIVWAVLNSTVESNLPSIEPSIELRYR